MVLCLSLKLLTGPPSCLHVSHGVLSAIITTIFRIVLLGYSLGMPNSILVQIYPPSAIAPEDVCKTLTIVAGINYHHIYEKTKNETLDILANLTDTEKSTLTYAGYEEGGSVYEEKTDATPYGSTYLLGYGSTWFTVRMNDENKRDHLYSYDDDGYQKYYYYCADLTLFLNNQWLPVLMWFLVNIVPPFLLGLIALIFGLRSNFLSTICRLPGILFSPVFSNLHVGPFQSGYLSFSRGLTLTNIIVTFLGLCVNLHLITAGFGQGDGRHLRYVLPFLIIVPSFIISALVSLCYICPCKSHSGRSVINPSEPGRLFVINSEGKIVPEEDGVGLNYLPSES